jgi:hypothetical protein
MADIVELPGGTMVKIEWPRCKASLRWPLSLTRDQKRAVASTTRIEVFEGARCPHRDFGMDLSDAKALAFHITRVPGGCYRCSKSVTNPVSACANCR